MGLSAFRFRFPGKAGGAAGRCKGGPEETALPRRGHHVTDGITAAKLLMAQSLPCHAKAVTTRPCLQPSQMEQAAQSVSQHSDTHAGGSRPRATPSPAPRAFVEQITSKCLALRHRERGKPRFVPGSAHNIKKAAELHLKTPLPANYQINPRISTAFLHYFLSQPNHKFT